MHRSSKARRLFKKAVQQGRSERRDESYFVPYVEPLSDARTMLAGFFNNLLGVAVLAGRSWPPRLFAEEIEDLKKGVVKITAP